MDLAETESACVFFFFLNDVSLIVVAVARGIEVLSLLNAAKNTSNNLLKGQSFKCPTFLSDSPFSEINLCSYL